MGKMDEEEKEVQASSYRISHRDKRCSTGNIINGIVMALYGDRWQLHLWYTQHDTELLNHYVVHLKSRERCVSTIRQ